MNGPDSTTVITTKVTKKAIKGGRWVEDISPSYSPFNQNWFSYPWSSVGLLICMGVQIQSSPTNIQNSGSENGMDENQKHNLGIVIVTKTF